MQKFKHIIAEKLRAALLEKFQREDEIETLVGMLEYPPDETLGDLAFPCFRYAKLLRMAPPKIAAALAEAVSDPAFSEVSAAGGYVNFKIANPYLTNEVLTAVEEKKDRYGSSDAGQGKTVVFDYSSPNICKPFHIGHLGTTVIGHSLKLLHAFEGYNCIGVNHLGDWGTQFGKQIVAFRLWGDRETVEKGGIDELVKLYVKFHEEADKDPSLNDKARAEFHKLEENDPENIALRNWFVEVSMKEYDATYGQLGIAFDSYKGESFYVDKVPEIVSMLRDKGLLKIDDGASIVDLSAYNMPPCLILKNDGTTIYPARDIAAAVYRKRTYDFDKCVYVTSTAQSLHFAQWFKVVELMGFDWADELVHVPYGTVSIGGAKLATRTGNVVLLKDLFRQSIEKVREIMDEKNPNLANKDETAEAVGVGAIVFNYLYNSRIKDINFTIESALSFDGSTGPYAQYTYARTCSILEKAAGVDLTASAGITAEEEAGVLKVLARFPEKVAQAVEEYEPCVIARFVIELCTAFNRFYKGCPILSAEDEGVKAFRIRLTAATGTVLSTALHLICLKTPEKI